MPLDKDQQLHADLKILSPIVNRGMLLLNGDKDLEFANDLACGLLGVVTEEELQCNWPTLKPWLRLDENSPTSKPRSFKIDLPMPGTPRYLRAEIHARADNSRGGYLMLLKDRMKMDALDCNLLLASQKQAQIYFQGAISHDLRAPLNSMQITLELLGETLAQNALDIDKSSEKRCIAVLKEELLRLNRKMRPVLDHNVLLNPLRQEFDLRDCIEELNSFLESQVRRQRVDLQSRLPDEPIKMAGQREWLKQALLNIFISSLEAMPNGGSLEIGAQLEKSLARITVKGRGPMMSDEQCEKIFALCFSAEKIPQAAGLYVARLLVELYGGDFHVDTSSGNCFTVQLPLASEQKTEDTANLGKNIFSSERI